MGDVGLTAVPIDRAFWQASRRSILLLFLRWVVLRCFQLDPDGCTRAYGPHLPKRGAKRAAREKYWTRHSC